MIFNKCLVIGEFYIIANFLIFFTNLKKKYFVEVNKTVCHRALVTAEAEAKERVEMAKTTTRLLQRPRPSQRLRV